ncbi:uncharacterized mitochondrial protein-like protein [Tanacetum coccineum]
MGSNKNESKGSEEKNFLKTCQNGKDEKINKGRVGAVTSSEGGNLMDFSMSKTPNAGFKPSGDDEKKVTEEPGKEGGDSSKDSKCSDQEKEDNVNNTNNINAASTNEVNVVGGKSSIELPDDPNMPTLEGIVYSDDDEDVGAEADMNNLDAFIPVSPIPTTRMDVKSVFLYGKIEEEVYVCQPLRFEDPDFPDRRGKIDKTLFIRRDKGDILLVQVYVDDIIFGSTKKSLCTDLKNRCIRSFNKMSSMGELTFFLGLQVTAKEDWAFYQSSTI